MTAVSTTVAVAVFGDHRLRGGAAVDMNSEVEEGHTSFLRLLKLSHLFWFLQLILCFCHF